MSTAGMTEISMGLSEFYQKAAKLGHADSIARLKKEFVRWMTNNISYLIYGGSTTTPLKPALCDRLQVHVKFFSGFP
jgi:hypothetical protein